MKHRFGISRRTAGWLMAVMAALVVIHYAYRRAPAALTRAVTGQPALFVSLRGEITQLSATGLTVTLEDAHGNLTSLTRHIVLTGATRYLSPGQPAVVGKKGTEYLKTGYRIIVRGQGAADNAVQAQVVTVTFPPIAGTVAQVSNGTLLIDVAGQPHPARVQLTSRTAFFVPNGNWSRLSAGAPIRVWVIPSQNTASGLVAITVMVVSPPPTGS
ncbi:MAG: hypothetical protein M0Z53_10775 [Thermaerobacter sp.]|nr:hypothetical protein [Thermaerobacter sp.]